MPASPQPKPAPRAGSRWLHSKAAVLAGVLVVAAVAMPAAMGSAASASPERQPAAGLTAAAGNEPTAQTVAEPARVHVASRGITASMIPLGTHDDGSLEVPADARTAGWWSGGAAPGQQGPSVIVGHVDSRDGPGAFFGLAEVAVGERVTVERTDGSLVHFRVRRVETHPKDAFPTAAVYGPTDAPTLRLVTCTGRFDPVVRSYDDNVVVFADLEADDAAAEAPQPTGAGELDTVGGTAAATPGPDRRVPIGVATLLLAATTGGVVTAASRTAQRAGR